MKWKNTSWWQILHFKGPETGRHNEGPPETKPTYSIHSWSCKPSLLWFLSPQESRAYHHQRLYWEQNNTIWLWRVRSRIFIYKSNCFAKKEERTSFTSCHQRSGFVALFLNLSTKWEKAIIGVYATSTSRIMHLIWRKILRSFCFSFLLVITVIPTHGARRFFFLLFAVKIKRRGRDRNEGDKKPSGTQGKPSQARLKTMLKQNFGGQIRCIMKNVEVANGWLCSSLKFILGYEA